MADEGRIADKACIYHHGCLDGFGSAWVVWKAWGPDTQFISARYGDEAPDVTGKQVIIVDFSYPRDILEAMNRETVSLNVLDHHKTARENCIGLPFAQFDMNRSGAIMTWDFFFEVEPPEIIKYIQDRDLWRFDLLFSKEVNAALYSYPFDFEKWDELINTKTIPNLINEGQAIVRDRQKLIDSLISGWAIERIDIAGHNVPCLNCPHWLASETLNLLARNEPFAISYSDSKDQRTFQLRSTENGIDVSEIAKQFGGGGHKHAAGFVTKKPTIIENDLTRRI